MNIIKSMKCQENQSINEGVNFTKSILRAQSRMNSVKNLKFSRAKGVRFLHLRNDTARM